MANDLEPLWQIEDELMALLDSVEVCPEELQPELEQRIAQYVRKEAAKVDRIGAVFALLENIESSAKAEIERLRARQRSAANAAERLQKYILYIIREREGRPLKGANVTLSLRHSEALVITNSAAVPEEWKRTVVTVDILKDPIKRALKAGREIPGVALEQHEHLVRR